MENVKVLGSIALPLKSIKTKCLCDDCGCEVNDSFGNPRIEIKTFDSKTSKEPSSVRWICESCADQQFGDHSSSSIFDGVPEYLRIINI